jgi:hypothetical protein
MSARCICGDSKLLETERAMLIPLVLVVGALVTQTLSTETAVQRAAEQFASYRNRGHQPQDKDALIKIPV